MPVTVEVLALATAAATFLALGALTAALWALRRDANTRRQLRDLQATVDDLDHDIGRIYTWADHHSATHRPTAEPRTAPQPAVHIAGGTRNNGATAINPLRPVPQKRQPGAHRRNA